MSFLCACAVAVPGSSSASERVTGLVSLSKHKRALYLIVYVMLGWQTLCCVGVADVVLCWGGRRCVVLGWQTLCCVGVADVVLCWCGRWQCIKIQSR